MSCLQCGQAVGPFQVLCQTCSGILYTANISKSDNKPQEDKTNRYASRILEAVGKVMQDLPDHPYGRLVVEWHENRPIHVEVTTKYKV